MKITEAPVRFDVAALRRGVEERDADCLLALYADDAEVQVVDRAHPPSSPRILLGRNEIGAYLDDICGRDMTHRIEHLVTDGNAASFLESCRYPGGGRVLCSATLDLAGGRIVREIAVQAWDE